MDANITKRIKLGHFALVVYFLLNSPFLSANFDGGMDTGGGLAIACFSNAATAVLVRENQRNISDDNLPSLVTLDPLDNYFASLPRGPQNQVYALVSAADEETSWEFSERILREIAFVLPVLGKSIITAAHEFAVNEVTLSQDPVTSVFDEAFPDLVIGDHCSLTAVAFQYSFEGQNYLRIDGRLFYHKSMDTTKQGILLLHEYLYLTARKSGARNSHNTRIMLASLLRKTGQLSLQDILATAVRLKFIPAADQLVRHVGLFNHLRENICAHNASPLPSEWLQRMSLEQRQLYRDLSDQISTSCVQLRDADENAIWNRIDGLLAAEPKYQDLWNIRY